MSEDLKKNSRGMAALNRARQLSASLSEAARLARVSGRGRSQYAGGGFASRKGAGALRLFIMLSFVLGVAVPSIVGTFYYVFWASDQYISQARFTVTNSIIPKLDGVAELTGLAQASIVRDTQVVTNFIHSRAAVEQIDAKVNLKAAYSREGIDYFSRFDPAKPIEKFVRYWEKMSSVSIQMPGGIIDLRVHAYSAEDARNIANAVVEISEDLINDLNRRINRDLMATTEAEVKRAAERLTAARVKLERVRQEERILDASKAGDSINTLITEARTVQLQLQREYASTSRLVSANTPQMRILKERLEGLAAQIAELEGKLTARDSPDGASIAQSLTRFSELELKRQIAERIYAGSLAAREVARVVAEQRQVYINTFVRPSLPDEAQYPRRYLMSIMIILASAAIWGSLVGMIVLMRNHMA